MKSLLLLLFVILSVWVNGCILNIEDASPLEMSLVTRDNDSLVYNYGKIAISFSGPIKATDSIFNFDPVFFDYTVTFSKGNDTAFIELNSDLRYNTKYTITGTDSLVSKSGDTVTNSIVFTTVMGEREPNNNFVTADSINYDTQYAGNIDPGSDVDYYIINCLNDSVFVNMSNIDSEFDVELYNENKSKIQTITVKKQSTVSFYTQNDGYYFIKISANSEKIASGRYLFRMSKK